MDDSVPERQLSTRPETTHMYQEAAEAAVAVERLLVSSRAALEPLAARIEDISPPFVATCARGSSDHAATFAKYLIERTLGLAVTSFAPSIASVYGAPLKLDGTLYLSISQSGGSPDLVAAARLAREQGALTVALVNVEASPLAEACEYVVPLKAGPETSVAATKSFIASLAVVLALVARLQGRTPTESGLAALPAALKKAWQHDASDAIKILANARNLFVIGRGPGLGVASEAALKFKETCGIHAEAFSAAEVRHGPMAIVERGFPVVLFSTPHDPDGGVASLAEDFIACGAQVVSFGRAFKGAINIPVPETLDPYTAFVCQVQAFYRLVNGVSIARGLDPDRPPHLRKVTETR